MRISMRSGKALAHSTQASAPLSVIKGSFDDFMKGVKAKNPALARVMSKGGFKAAGRNTFMTKDGKAAFVTVFTFEEVGYDVRFYHQTPLPTKGAATFDVQVHVKQLDLLTKTFLESVKAAQAKGVKTLKDQAKQSAANYASLITDLSSLKG